MTTLLLIVRENISELYLNGQPVAEIVKNELIYKSPKAIDQLKPELEKHLAVLGEFYEKL